VEPGEILTSMILLTDMNKTIQKYALDLEYWSTKNKQCMRYGGMR
jgi:hypothetical protein